MVAAIGRPLVERSTDYTERRRVDPDADRDSLGPRLGPRADGTPLVATAGSPVDEADDDRAHADD
jgi:FO synthase subunit 2